MLIQAPSDGDQINLLRLWYVSKTNNNLVIVIFQLSIGIITSHYTNGRTISERMNVVLLRYRVSQRYSVIEVIDLT